MKLAVILLQLIYRGPLKWNMSWLWAGRVPTSLSHQVKKSIGLTAVGLTQGSTASITCCQHFQNGSAQSYPCPHCHHNDSQILTMPPNIIKQEHLDLHGAIVPAHELQPALHPQHVLLGTCLQSSSCRCSSAQTPQPTAHRSSKLSLQMHHSELLSLSKGWNRNSVLHCSIYAVAYSSCLQSYCYVNIYGQSQKTIRNIFIS